MQSRFTSGTNIRNSTIAGHKLGQVGAFLFALFIVIALGVGAEGRGIDSCDLQRPGHPFFVGLIFFIFLVMLVEDDVEKGVPDTFVVSPTSHQEQEDLS